MANRLSSELNAYENGQYGDGTRSLQKASAIRGKVRQFKGTVVLDGNETDGMTVEIARLYHGQVLRPMSKLYFEALGSDVTVSVGHEAYTKRDGTQVNADATALLGVTTATAAGSAELNAMIEGFEADTKDEYISIILTFGQATAINTTAGRKAVAHLDIVEN